jgi:hypothetical protein
VVVQKKKLELIPNEVVGYRIRPDQWNWSVVVVKVHGKDSKNAGQQYETPLPAYCKSIGSAVEVIFNRVAALEGRKLQDETFDREGLCCDLKSLKEAFFKAQDAALWAVKDLEERVKEAGVPIADLAKRMKGINPVEDDTEEVEDVA